MKEPAYPVFFPRHTPTETGYRREWFWYDPNIEADDQGPFPERDDAVADWGVRSFTNAVAAESVALSEAIKRLPPWPATAPGLSPAELEPPRVSEPTYTPRTETGRALLLFQLTEQRLADGIEEGLALVASLGGEE